MFTNSSGRNLQLIGVGVGFSFWCFFTFGLEKIKNKSILKAIWVELLVFLPTFARDGVSSCVTSPCFDLTAARHEPPSRQQGCLASPGQAGPRVPAQFRRLSPGPSCGCFAPRPPRPHETRRSTLATSSLSPLSPRREFVYSHFGIHRPKCSRSPL